MFRVDICHQGFDLPTRTHQTPNGRVLGMTLRTHHSVAVKRTQCGFLKAVPEGQLTLKVYKANNGS